MKRFSTMLALIAVGALGGALGVFSVAAQAQTLRWASQGDLQTVDPHSQNESMTNMMNGQVHEKLVNRNKTLDIVPALATEWKQLSPTLWRFKLRPGVKFHDGTPFTADDVVFSIERSQKPTSAIASFGNAVGTARKVDELTVEFQLAAPNPIFLGHLETLWIMSKVWCEKNNVLLPLDFKNKQENFAALHANGTGPYMLVSRAPGVKTVYKRNPNWWNRFEGNVQEVQFTPISNDATRLAALLSNELDFVLDPAPRDIPRLRQTADLKIAEGTENRVVFVAMDQFRDELLYGSKGKNPFKDVRVRQALYQAVDVETLKTRLMRGQSAPTGGLTPSPTGAYNDPALEKRLPFDVSQAQKLMKEAGFAEGFEVTLDCPNNRYINDEEICVALSNMWAALKVKVKVNAMPRAQYFPKLEKQDTSMYLLGWGGAITDAETAMTPLYRTRGAKGVGSWNFGGYQNPKIDALMAQSSVEPDAAKREALIKSALQGLRGDVAVIPLHRQVIPWAMRSNVNVVHRPDNWLELAWVTVAASKK
jgi:peptide/nickel transport system substrate-binding protein